MRLHAVAAAAVVVAAGAGICAGLRASAASEALLAGALIFPLAVLYFSVLLYRGVGFDAGVVSWRFTGTSMRSAVDGTGNLPWPDLAGIDSGEGLLGALFAIVVAVLAALAAVVLVWLGLNLLEATAIGLGLALYGLFRRSLRVVMANLRRTRGQLLTAIATATWYAGAYTLVLIGVLWLIDAGAQRLTIWEGRAPARPALTQVELAPEPPGSMGKFSRPAPPPPPAHAR
jgi:hypothetical protein